MRAHSSSVVMAVLLGAAASAMGAQRPAGALDAAQIEQLAGAKGQMNEAENVFKISVPRTDLVVRAAGVRLTPAMGLTSWAAFMPSGTGTMVMGDLVLTEGQVNPVMSVALENGLEVTALHNHFMGDSPKVMFMHIAGTGDQARLATAVGLVLAKIQQTSKGGAFGAGAPAIDPAKSTLSPARIETILGQKGELANGVYKVTFGRTVRMHGQEMDGAMGVATWAAFAGSDTRAVVDGDFAMTEAELQGVLKALRHAGINVVAIHNHMTGEEPRVLFLHFWGTGTTEALAKGLKAALDTQQR